MLEKKLIELLENAKQERQYSTENCSSSYFNDVFNDLSRFIKNKLNKGLFRNRNAKIIVNHLDEILPYIVGSNIDILLTSFNLLMEQPNFKEKFICGLKKYPYKDSIDELFYSISCGLYNEPNKFDNFIDNDILETISTMDDRIYFYSNMLNRLNEENQKNFIYILVKNKCDIPYSTIEYKGNNKNIIYDNLSLFMENSQNLYDLMNFVKENTVAFSQVKDYINSNEEQAMNSMFCKIGYNAKIEDSTLKEIIKLMILEVMKNENVKFSDISYTDGGFSSVILCGEKVIKVGNRYTKSFPNNPYIIAPLLRQELSSNNEPCFIEITERVDTSTNPSKGELYELFKKMRDLHLVWTDIKGSNVGRLKRENVIHWKENLSPTEEVLGLDSRRGETVLQEGDLVILDSDFIYDENDLNINYANNKALYDEFEDRYQKEKKQLTEQKVMTSQAVIEQCSVTDDEIKDENHVGKSL